MLTACAVVTPTPTPISQAPAPSATAAPADNAATKPATRPTLSFPTVVPSATPQRQFTPTASAQGEGSGLPTLTPVWVHDGRTVLIELSNYAFKPARLAAWVGEPITLRVRNVDVATAHLFDIAALNVAVVVSAAEEKTVTFTVEEPGAYDITCPLDAGGVNHAMAGMIGELRVERRP